MDQGAQYRAPWLCRCNKRLRPQSRSIAAAAATTTVAATTAATIAASTTAATGATAAAVTAAATATATRFAWLGLVDCQPAPVILLVVQALDRRLSLCFGVHFDESEPLATTSVTVLDDLCALHGPELGEPSFEVG